MSLERIYISIIKAIYDKPKANIILDSKKTESFSSKIRNKTRVSSLTTFIQESTGSTSHSNQTRKKKDIQTDKKEVKLLQFADDMTL